MPQATFLRFPCRFTAVLLLLLWRAFLLWFRAMICLISPQLTLKDTRSLPVQVDGEPWEEGPCVITITHHNQALMLGREEKEFVAWLPPGGSLLLTSSFVRKLISSQDQKNISVKMPSSLRVRLHGLGYLRRHSSTRRLLPSVHMRTELTVLNYS